MAASGMTMMMMMNGTSLIPQFNGGGVLKPAMASPLMKKKKMSLGPCCSKSAVPPLAKPAKQPPQAPLPQPKKEAAAHPPPPPPQVRPPMEIMNRPSMEVVPPHGQPYSLRAPLSHMRSYWDGIEHLSRIPRLDNIEMTLARGYKVNFRDYPCDFHHDSRHGRNCQPPHPSSPLPVDYTLIDQHTSHHYYCAHLPPPPPPPGNFEGPAPPPPHAYYQTYQYNYFSDENPNGCTAAGKRMNRGRGHSALGVRCEFIGSPTNLIMVASTSLMLFAGRFGLAPSANRRANASLRLERWESGLQTGDPAGFTLADTLACGSVGHIIGVGVVLGLKNLGAI